MTTGYFCFVLRQQEKKIKIQRSLRNIKSLTNIHSFIELCFVATSEEEMICILSYSKSPPRSLPLQDQVTLHMPANCSMK